MPYNNGEKKMTNSESIEHRHQFRGTTHLVTTVVIDGKAIDSPIINISTGGAKLDVETPIAEGQHLMLRIDGYGEFRAVTTWQHGRELGITFTHDPLKVAELVLALAEL